MGWTVNGPRTVAHGREHFAGLPLTDPMFSRAGIPEVACQDCQESFGPTPSRISGGPLNMEWSGAFWRPVEMAGSNSFAETPEYYINLIRIVRSMEWCMLYSGAYSGGDTRKRLFVYGVM